MTLMAVLGMTGCLRDSDLIDCPPEDNTKAIVFTPAVRGNTRATSAASGSLIESGDNIPSGGSFGAYAYNKQTSTSSVTAYTPLQNQKVTYDGTDFTYTPVAIWPIQSGAQLSFYGYYPWQDQGTTPAAGDPAIRVTMGPTDLPSMSIAYTTPADPGKQVDLMYAHAGLSTGYDPVHLAFGHALTRVNFQARKEDYTGDVVITKITIRDVLTKGTLAVTDATTPVWSGLSTAAEMSLTASNGLNPGYVLTGTMATVLNTGGDMLVIPQGVQSFVIEVEATHDGVRFPEPFICELAATPDWEMNKIVTYQINFGGTGMDITTVVNDWDNNDIGIIGDGQWSLSVSKDDYVFAKGGGLIGIDALTDYNLDSQGYPAGLQFDEAEIVYGDADGDWLTLSGATGTLSETIGITAADNTTAGARTAKVRVKAGNLTKVINIAQLPQIDGAGTIPADINTYVGAFWRAAQTGERVIKIDVGSTEDYTGDWSAYVYWTSDDWADGDIVLAKGGSGDPNIYEPGGATPGDAEGFPVSGSTQFGAQFISGKVSADGSILFRIGLNSAWTATTDKPARYAVVGLSYSSNSASHKIFLRQGEGQAVVMGTAKWPAYNLSDPLRGTTGHIGGSALGNHKNLTSQAAFTDKSFTDFPTQAGFYFRWNELRAYHPTNPTGAITSWAGATTYYTAWDTAREACPAGYRHPGPVQIATDFVGADVQSCGFYADGFFDRGELHDNFSAQKVGVGSEHDVAYIGMLFANNSTNASLFLPAAGDRDHSAGVLQSTSLVGIQGLYRSRSNGGHAGVDNNLNININTGTVTAPGNNGKAHGFSVRCVLL